MYATYFPLNGSHVDEENMNRFLEKDCCKGYCLQVKTDGSRSKLSYGCDMFAILSGAEKKP